MLWDCKALRGMLRDGRPLRGPNTVHRGAGSVNAGGEYCAPTGWKQPLCTSRMAAKWEGSKGTAYSFVVCFGRLTIDYASLAKWGGDTVHGTEYNTDPIE